MFAKKQILTVLILCLMAMPAQAALVWQSTFDATPDGVVDVKDRDTTKVMIGPVSGGRLQITTKDRAAAFNSNDRAGRPLGATLSGNSSFSARYLFRWSSLPTATADTWQGVGFIGSDACPTTCLCSPNVCNTTRQVCGALLRHHRDETSGNNLVRLGIQYGESGAGNHFYNGSASEIDLGPDAAATTTDFYLALGFDGASHVLSLALYTSAGALLGTVSADLDTSPGGLLPIGANSVQNMLDNLQLTHLGWNDYVAAQNGQTVIWQVDSLSYYNDARGAFDSIPNQGTGACCIPDGTCEENHSQQGCEARGGTWGGGGSACGTTVCPPAIGACCNPDGSCDQLTSADCSAQNGTWQGGNTACSLTNCPQPPTGACCSDLDGSCSDGMTEFNCQGTWQGAATTCAGTNCPPPAGGACCLPNGACIQASSGQCALQCGTFSGAGTDCGSANCTQPPAGACCLPDGSCSMTQEYNCAGAFHGSGSSCATANCQPMPTLVWWDNFATSNAGLADVKDNNITKDLIGSQCDGQVTIHNRASPSNFENTDRGGGPVGATLTGNDSFSGLYRFRWSDLSELESINNELVSFVGDASNSTQQVFGAMLAHNKVGDDYFVRMCSAAGEAGSYFLFQCGATFNLGPDAETRQLQLALAYDGTTHLLSHAIFDDQGVLLGEAPTLSFGSWDLDTECPTSMGGVGCQNYFDCPAPPPGCTKQVKYDRTALTHLGWSDYASLSGTTQDTIWQLDSLAYFNDAGGAYNAVFGALDRGACCRADGTCSDNDTELACLAAGGGWGGTGTTCATTVCSGACCLPNADCLDAQTVPQCSTAGGAFQGLNTTCAGTSCPLPPCEDPFADSDGDGDVDGDDFGAFQRCYSGSFTPYMNPGQCHCFDRDNDTFIDGDDFVDFVACHSGADVPADAGCDDAP